MRNPRCPRCRQLRRTGRPTTRTDGISRRDTSPAASAVWRAREPWKEWSQETAPAGRNTGRSSAGSGTDGAGLASQIDVQAGGEFLGLAHTREAGSENQPRQRFFRMRLTFRMHCHAREARRSQRAKTPRLARAGNAWRRRNFRNPGRKPTTQTSLIGGASRPWSGEWLLVIGQRPLVHGTLTDIGTLMPRGGPRLRAAPLFRSLQSVVMARAASTRTFLPSCPVITSRDSQGPLRSYAWVTSASLVSCCVPSPKYQW